MFRREKGGLEGINMQSNTIEIGNYTTRLTHQLINQLLHYGLRVQFSHGTHFYGLQINVLSLDICTHDTGMILSVGQSFIKKERKVKNYF